MDKKQMCTYGIYIYIYPPLIVKIYGNLTFLRLHACLPLMHICTKTNKTKTADILVDASIC